MSRDIVIQSRYINVFDNTYAELCKTRISPTAEIARDADVGPYRSPQPKSNVT